MIGQGVAAVGECMLELSGQGGADWRMGFAGDTLNTLWALRALTGRERAANYVSAFGDDPFSRKQIAFFAVNGIGIGESPVIPGVPWASVRVPPEACVREPAFEVDQRR